MKKKKIGVSAGVIKFLQRWIFEGNSHHNDITHPWRKGGGKCRTLSLLNLDGLQSNFSLWSVDICLSLSLLVHPSVIHIWLPFAVKFWDLLCNLAIPYLAVSC